MKRSLLNFTSTTITALILSQFLPWWSLMVAAFMVMLIFPLKRMAVFFIPFLAIFLLWSVSAYMLSSGNDFILAKKIAVLFPLNGNPYLLMLVSGLLGGTAAGVAGITGKQCLALFKK